MLFHPRCGFFSFGLSGREVVSAALMSAFMIVRTSGRCGSRDAFARQSYLHVVPVFACDNTMAELRNAAYTVSMLTIQISWEYALGIIGAIIAGSASIAWYASGRFTALETSMDWVKSTLIELKVAIDNMNAQKLAFGAASPINLNPSGTDSASEQCQDGVLPHHPLQGHQ